MPRRNLSECKLVHYALGKNLWFIHNCFCEVWLTKKQDKPLSLLYADTNVEPCFNKVLDILQTQTNLVNCLWQSIWQRGSPHENPVVLVGWLGQAGYGRLLTDCLTVRHHRVRHFDGDACMVLLQIFQADFQVQLSSTGNDVLARLLNHALEQVTSQL